MQKKIIAISLIFTAILLLPIITVNAWVYPDCTEDDMFEKFGPRVDRILIKLYDGDTAEFMALEGHEIDITDWTLTHTWKEKFQTEPENEYIKCVSYGPDYGMNELDLNNNDTIAFRDGLPCVTREPAMRRAIAYLCDKDLMVETCAGGQGFPLYSLLGPGWTKYSHPEIMPGGALEELAYLFSCPNARATIVLGPFRFQAGANDYGVISSSDDHLEWDPGTGWEDVILDFFIRSDDPERKCAGEMIAAAIEDCLGAKVAITYGDSTAAKQKVMADKDFNMYTGGWGLSYDPDWPWYLYSIDWYWHPGRPLNYGHMNCSAFNHWSYILATANTQEEAVMAAWECQLALANPDCVGVIPLWEAEGMKPYRKTYLGTPTVSDGEDDWEGLNWYGVVNEMGFGINTWWTFLNMRPEGVECGDGENMTVRYGMRVPDMRALNPMYSEWLYDYNVLGLIYDSLLMTNPYDLSEWMPYIAESYTVGVIGETMYVDFTLRNDVYWSDGVQFTTADVEFCLHSAEELLAAKGCPDPWFSQSTWAVDNVTITDTLNCRVYLVEKSLWALHSVGGSIMFPKHIWEPLILNPAVSCEDLQGWAPDLDPALVGTGPFMFVEYIEASHVLLVKNPTYFWLPEACKNSVPLARFTPATCETYYLDRFSGEVTVDFDGTIAVSGYSVGTEYPITSWDWTFGDGGVGTGATTSHAYTAVGDKDAALTVTASGCPVGTTGTATHTIHILAWYYTADFDGDGDVDEDDLWHFCAAFINYWSTGGLDELCDFDGDLDIDEDDLWTFCAAFISYWQE